MRKFFFLTSFLLIGALLLTACGKDRLEDPYSLTIWYVEGTPLSDALPELAESYNRSRGQGTLPVTLRAWSEEERLLYTLQNSAPPALVLCSHASAFSLYERGRLKDLNASGSSYPAWLSERSASVGHGFYPLGFALQLVCSREPDIPDTYGLWEQAAAYGRETGLPYLSVDAFAPLLYQLLLDQGVEFTADPSRDEFIEDYVNLYNVLALSAFTHGLHAGGDLDTPIRIADSTTLRGQNLDGFRVHPLSDSALLAEAWGVAVTARDTRMQRALPDFLRWLFEPERAGALGLNTGLIPIASETLSPADPLEAALLSLCGRELHLPDGSSPYYVNRVRFEEDFHSALELLH